MKRMVPWSVGISGVAVVLAVQLGGSIAGMSSAEAANKDKGQPAAAASATPAEGQKADGKKEEKIVYTFEDEQKMQEFTKLWQQRQGIVLRMTVLKSYWDEEQVALTQLNNKLAADYKLDSTKNYFLDGQRRVIIERDTPPAMTPAPAPSTPATPNP